MVGLILLLLFGSSGPFDWECPQSVEAGERFSLRITCSEPGCSGISAGSVALSPGLTLLGSSTSTSISAITTPNGRQLTQVVVLDIMFSATAIGDSTQTIGPLQLNLHGIGSYTLDEIAVTVNGSVAAGISQSVSPADIPLPEEDVWLTGILRDPQGRIYPGTILFFEYYVYSRVDVGNVTYWWGAPELGVIRHVETIPDSNWESLDAKRDNASRSLLAEIEMAPAAAGSLLAPKFWADITGTDYDRWGKISEWTIESAPIILPVFPFPDNPPQPWDETLLDSVAVRIEQLPNPPGQGGELSVRVTCIGPGSIYMNEPPILTLQGEACLLPLANGSTGNKKWWDFILEPEETGYCILGPDSVVWLNRRNYTYQTVYIEPCSLNVTVIPWCDRVIELDDVSTGGSPLCWVTAVVVGVLSLTVLLGKASKQRDKRLASVANSEDIDELLSGLESELSKLLSGKKEYLGYEELDDFLKRSNTDNFLARRILRFWRDLEQSLSDKELTKPAFQKLKSTAEELLYKLRKDLKSNNEKE